MLCRYGEKLFSVCRRLCSVFVCNMESSIHDLNAYLIDVNKGGIAGGKDAEAFSRPCNT